MILKNIRYLITQNADRQILENVDVKVAGNRISAIGQDLPTEDEEVLDCSGKVVMPGLINAHTHVSMTLLRGISDHKSLEDWLHEDIFPAEEKLDAEDAYIGAKLGCMEMLRSGTTTFNDMYEHMDRVAEAVDGTGIRAVLSRGVLDIDGGYEERIGEGVDLYVDYHDHDRIEVGFAPHAAHTASEEVIEELKEFAEENGAPFHIHVSETRKEVEEFMKEHLETPIQRLDRMDLLNENLIAAHCVWLMDEEKDLLAEKGGNVVHNPAANLKLGSGIADIPGMLDQGVNVALGTDGAASNNNLNLFEEGKLAALIHKRESPGNITDQEVLDMMTVNGAKALGLEDEIGSIAVGKRADIVTIELSSPEMRPFHGKEGLISNLVYSFGGGVEEVIVDGNHVIKEGRHGLMDEEKIMEEAEIRAERFR